MTDDLGPEELERIPFAAAEAAAAIEALRAPAERAARAVDEAFAAAGDSLARSLARAAADGEVSMAELARAVIAAVEAAARASGGGGGLAEALTAAVAGVFSGARADGGSVAGGGAYLVGERGPELFRPAVSGTLETTAPAALAVTVTVKGDGREGLLRSEAQLAQAVWRAASLGGRRGW